MSKSEIMKQVAEKLGLPIIEIKASKAEHSDFLGLPIIDKLMIIDDCDPVIDAMTREIKVGDTVLMEYARGVVETVVVDEIDDGMVYATGDDGEPFCAPLANCDKIPA